MIFRVTPAEFDSYTQRETGYKPTLDVDMAAKLQKLLAQQDVYRDQLAELDADQTKYLAWLDKWAEKGLYVGPTAEDQEVPEAKIGTRSEGWYDGCTDQLITYAGCAGAYPYCSHIGTDSSPSRRADSTAGFRSNCDAHARGDRIRTEN